jgi:hypothetical protein
MTKGHTELLQRRLAEIAACLSTSEQMLANLRDASRWDFLTEDLDVNREELIADYEARIARDERLQDTLGQLLAGQAY